MIHKLTIQEKDGHFHGLSYLQSKIVTEMIKIRNLYTKDHVSFNCIFIPHSILNIISDSKHFHKELISEEDTLVGVISNMNVYIDFNLPRNHIRLSVDKGKYRNIKINSILSNDNSEYILEAIIEVDSDLI